MKETKALEYGESGAKDFLEGAEVLNAEEEENKEGEKGE